MTILYILLALAIGAILGATIGYRWVNRQIGGAEKTVSAGAANLAETIKKSL